MMTYESNRKRMENIDDDDTNHQRERKKRVNECASSMR